MRRKKIEREPEEVYGISNSTNTIFLCDIYDSDFERLSDENIIRTVVMGEEMENGIGSYILTDDKFKDILLKFKV